LGSKEASDVLWVCSFETFDALDTSRGKSLDEVVEMITSIAVRMLCRPTRSFA